MASPDKLSDLEDEDDSTAAPVVADAPPQVASTPTAAPTAPATSDEGMLAQSDAPSAVVPVTAKALPPHTIPAPSAQEYGAHDMHEANDMANGKITPQTYESMFSKKDTLPKIGTIFGLLLSGAGSGLSHQPNALLEMMNKQIQNDLEAQKQNVGNAQNFLNMSYNHELQQAQQRRMAIENQGTQAGIGLTKAQTQKANIENVGTAAKTQFESNQYKDLNNPAQTPEPPKLVGPDGNLSQGNNPNGTPVDSGQPSSGPALLDNARLPPPTSSDMKQAAAVAPFRAANRMRNAALQKLSDVTANNPQGQAMVKNVAMPAVAAENERSNQQAASAAQLVGSQDPANQDVVNRAEYDKALKIGMVMPGNPKGIANPAAVNDEFAKVKALRSLYYNEYLPAFSELSRTKAGGQNPWGKAATSIIKAGVTGLGSLLGSPAGPAGIVGGGVAGSAVAAGLNDSGTWERNRDVLLGQLRKTLGKDVDVDALMPAWQDQFSDDPKIREKAFNKGNAAFQRMEQTISPTLTSQFPQLKTPFQLMPYSSLTHSTPVAEEKPKQTGVKAWQTAANNIAQ